MYMPCFVTPLVGTYHIHPAMRGVKTAPAAAAAEAEAEAHELEHSVGRKVENLQNQ